MYGRLHLPARLVPRLTPGDVASASELPVAASYRIGARTMSNPLLSEHRARRCFLREHLVDISDSASRLGE